MGTWVTAWSEDAEAARARVQSAARRLRDAGHLDEFAERYIVAAFDGQERDAEGGEMGKGNGHKPARVSH